MTLKFHSRTPSLLQDCTLRLRTRRFNSGIRAETSPLILLALIALFLPWLAFAGHGVEDTVDNLSAERAKQPTKLPRLETQCYFNPMQLA